MDRKSAYDDHTHLGENFDGDQQLSRVAVTLAMLVLAHLSCLDGTEKRREV